jgi:hypothetical protein
MTSDLAKLMEKISLLQSEPTPEPIIEIEKPTMHPLVQAMQELRDEELREYNIRKTKKFIQRAHDQEQGQMYGDMPYSSHPKQVANLGKKFFGPKFNDEAVKVALLHDVLEDTPYTPEQLAKKGFSKEVIQAVQLLTKNKALSYADNIRAIINSGNPLAMMVKYSDNYMNYTGDKSHWAPDRAAHSQKKYLASLNMLGDVLGIKKHIGGEEMVNEKAGDVYSARQAEIIKDLGNGYFLGDDSYDDDDGFVKAGYSVYKQVGDDSFRMIDSVDMSPYSNSPGHIENEIKKIIASDQNNLSENADYLEASYAGQFGKFIEPAILPLGFDWKIGISLLTSLAAREVFVGTMSTIYSVSGADDDLDSIREAMLKEKNPHTGKPTYSLATVFSLLLFYAFALQCMSTVAIVKKETASAKWAIIQFVYLTVLAYGSSLLVYQIFG